jgi:hypothetical protein
MLHVGLSNLFDSSAVPVRRRVDQEEMYRRMIAIDIELGLDRINLGRGLATKTRANS